MPKNPDKPLAPKAARLMPQPTLRLVYADYRKFRKMKISTIEKYESVIDSCYPDWWERNLNTISKDEILERHLAISTKNGPRGVGTTQANYAFRILRALFKYAQGRYEDVNLEPVVRRNPVNVLTSTKAWNKSKRRTRIISKGKMRHWFRALQEYPNDSIRDYLTFIFLTGCRRTESVILQWSWVDLEHGIVTFPGAVTKNGNELVLPLCGYLWHLLRERRTRNDADPVWVFPGGTATQKTGKHLSNQLKCSDKIFQKSGVDWSVHDLRRSYATVALKCVKSDIIVKRLINHSMGNDVTAGYICLDPEDLRPYVDKIAETILEYSGYRFIPKVGLVRLENAEQVETNIQEGALLNALRKLDPKTLKEIAKTFDRPQTLKLVVAKNA